MTEIEALKAVLQLYIETTEPVTSGFYRGLCLKAKTAIKQLESENKQLHFKLGRIFSKLGDMSAGKVSVGLAVQQILEIGMEKL